MKPSLVFDHIDQVLLGVMTHKGESYNFEERLKKMIPFEPLSGGYIDYNEEKIKKYDKLTLNEKGAKVTLIVTKCKDYENKFCIIEVKIFKIEPSFKERYLMIKEKVRL